MHIFKVIFLIGTIVFSAIVLGKEGVEAVAVKNSDFLQYQFQCEIEVPISRVVQEAWEAILDSHFAPPEHIKTILETKEKVIVMHTYIPIAFPIDDRDIITCGTWEKKDKYEGDRMSWNVCERDRVPLNNGVIRILHSNGSWEFNSNAIGGTIITIKSHTDPGGLLPAIIVNKFSGDQLIDDCQRLRKRIGSIK